MTQLAPNTGLRFLAERITRDAAEYGTRFGYWEGCGQYKVYLGSIPGWDLSQPGELETALQLLRTGLLTFARADLVAAMDPELLARSEWVLDRLTQFHFLVVQE